MHYLQLHPTRNNSSLTALINASNCIQIGHIGVVINEPIDLEYCLYCKKGTDEGKDINLGNFA